MTELTRSNASIKNATIKMGQGQKELKRSRTSLNHKPRAQRQKSVLHGMNISYLNCRGNIGVMDGEKGLDKEDIKHVTTTAELLFGVRCVRALRLLFCFFAFSNQKCITKCSVALMVGRVSYASYNLTWGFAVCC